MPYRITDVRWTPLIKWNSVEPQSSRKFFESRDRIERYGVLAYHDRLMLSIMIMVSRYQKTERDKNVEEAAWRQTKIQSAAHSDKQSVKNLIRFGCLDKFVQWAGDKITRNMWDFTRLSALVTVKIACTLHVSYNHLPATIVRGNGFWKLYQRLW